MTFSDSIDTICEKATEVAQITAKKAKDLKETAKTNLAVRREKEAIRKAMLELGKLYYRDYAGGKETDKEKYLPWCRKIDEARKNIAQMQEHLEEVKAQPAAAPQEPAQEKSADPEMFADAQEELEVVTIEEVQPPEE